MTTDSIKTIVSQVECPFCHKTTSIGSITTEKVSINLCPECHRCWEILSGSTKVDRLVRFKDNPDAKFNELKSCPDCWREMTVNFERWVIRCPDPICGYEKKMPGISLKQTAIRNEYLEVRNQIFELTLGKKDIPKELADKYKTLQEQYQAFRNQDPDNKESPFVPAPLVVETEVPSKDEATRISIELSILKGRRSAIILEISEARAQGDLKENAPYHAARSRKSLLDSRITELERKLAHAKVGTGSG